MNKEGKGNLRDRVAPSKMMQARQSTCVFGGTALWGGVAGGTADRWPAAQQRWYGEGGKETEWMGEGGKETEWTGEGAET